MIPAKSMSIDGRTNMCAQGYTGTPGKALVSGKQEMPSSVTCSRKKRFSTIRTDIGKIADLPGPENANPAGNRDDRKCVTGKRERTLPAPALDQRPSPRQAISGDKDHRLETLPVTGNLSGQNKTVNQADAIDAR